MWNKWLVVLQEPAYKRLGTALCLSALLHFFLVGKFYLLLPDNKPALHTIEARLQLPKVVPKPMLPLPAETTPKSKNQAKPKLVKPPAQQSIQPDDAPLAIDHLPPPTEVASTETPEPAPQSTPVEALASESIDISDPLPTPADSAQQTADESFAINENAYRYVETSFNVSTKIGGSPDGTATMTYSVLDNGDYQINSLAKADGLAALILSELMQTSDGALTKTGLRPSKFTYNYGNKASKSRLATFDWQAKAVKLETSAGTQIEPLQEDTQDLLSFMYQFMYVPPLHKMQIHIVNGKSLRTYDYSFEGEEVISLPIGQVNTIHIQHSNNETDEKIELWLAVDYQHLPVKILKIDKNGKAYEFTATRINTTLQPVAN